MDSVWRLLWTSVAGTSHDRRDQPCQDFSHARVLGGEEVPVLIAVCADGAGSASHAAVGAKIACLGVLRAGAEAIEAGLQVTTVTRQQVLSWYDRARRRISLEACLRNLDLGDFACTLLTAIVSREAAVFTQIGDGAIVFHDGGGYQTATWPQTGEYANMTYFLTSPDWEERLAFRSVLATVDELALITDGLQPLALQYAARAVHAPFFDPMFAALRHVLRPTELEGPLRDFLGSRPVNDRTDDDKTLMLATRRPATHDHS